MPVIQARGRMRQEDKKLKAHLNYTMRPCVYAASTRVFYPSQKYIFKQYKVGNGEMV